MNPKCPWCGGDMYTWQGAGTRRWYVDCRNTECTTKKSFNTESEALAAASKRFMPKRSVEEIERAVMKIIALNIDGKKQMEDNFEKNGESYIMAIMCHRIADYMTGVTE